MTFRPLSSMAARWLGATALATVLAILPIGVTIHGPADNAALAKGGNGGGGDRGGGPDKGGPDKGGPDKSAGRDDGGRGDRGNGRGNDIASRGHDGRGHDSRGGRDVSVASLGRDVGRGDRGRDVSRGFDRSLSERRDGDRRDGDRRDGSRSFSDRLEGGKNTLGNLNAAHASATARANASPNSMVGRIATYESQMNTALAIRDRSERNAAIIAAREQLAESANKPLTAGNIARVDAMLGIRGASPQLGAERSRSSDRNRDVSRVSFDDRRDGRRDGRRDRDFHDFFGHHHHGFGGSFGRGVGFGNLPVDPARIEARATALDARGDRIAAEIRAAADRRAAEVISRAEARAAELRAREATAKDPARLEARAVSIVERANALAAATIARADARATAVNARIDDRVETLQAIAAYDRAMIAALALNDPTAQTAAITAARSDLRAAIDRPLSGRTIDRLDNRLGLEDTPSAVASRGSIGIGLDG
ncbi:MAG: hypothetical protein JNL04_09215 [Rhodospirillaceae bacterium]|nr:hypothetical protein [Rhodospirillaceae bacterium]